MYMSSARVRDFCVSALAPTLAPVPRLRLFVLSTSHCMQPYFAPTGTNNQLNTYNFTHVFALCDNVYFKNPQKILR